MINLKSPHRKECRHIKAKLFSLLARAALIAGAGILLWAAAAAPAGAAGEEIYVLKVEGTITRGQLGYIQRNLETAQKEGAPLVVIILNTPGGLVDATLKINEAFLNAAVPIAVLVSPQGAIAASAGAFLVLGSDIAAMAPGTTVGAAHPVAISAEGTTPADDKTANFLAKHLRSLAREKGRPADVAEKFVTENLTLDAEEALEQGVIEYLAFNLEGLLETLDGHELEKMGQRYVLLTADTPVKYVEPNLRERLQNWLSDPQIAFLLLSLGLLGIYLGISAPGTFVPEVIGGILLVLGIYGIGLFDTNTAGLVLLLLGAGLIIAEIFTPGFGVLGIGGGVCLLAGAILLPVEPLMSPQWYESFRLTVTGTVVGLTLLFLLIAYQVYLSRRRSRDGSAFFRPPERGVVVEELAPSGLIRARGELWKARSHDGTVIAVGEEVEVVRAEALTLWVRPAAENNQD